MCHFFHDIEELTPCQEKLIKERSYTPQDTLTIACTHHRNPLTIAWVRFYEEEKNNRK